MSWIELSLDTTAEGVDWIRTLLATTARTGEMPGELRMTHYAPAGTTPDIRTTATPPWAFTLRLYLPDEVGVRSQIEAIASALSSLHRTGLTTELEISRIADLPPSTGKAVSDAVGHRFVVVPPGAAVSLPANRVPLTLNASLAFGSGFHPATRLSLQLLERYVVPGMQALDLGSGSGILSVAMAKLGAWVLALDNDPVAVRSTQDAVELNSVTQQVTVRQGSLGAGSTLGHWMGGESHATPPTLEAIPQFELIAANILARIHIALAEDYRQALRRTDGQPAILVTAGFTTESQAEVTGALLPVGFEVMDTVQWEDWVAIAYRLAAS